MYAFWLAWHSVRFVVMAHGSYARPLLLGEDELEYSGSNLGRQAEEGGGGGIALHSSKIVSRLMIGHCGLE